MAFEAQFVRGDPIMADHTPGTAVDAGAVVVVGNVPAIAHHNIAANALGALAVGGGIYTVPTATGSTTAIAAGKVVYWDDSESVVTETATDNFRIGITLEANLDADAAITILHVVDGVAAAQA